MDKNKTKSPEVSTNNKKLEAEFLEEKNHAKKWIIVGVIMIAAIILGVVISNIFSKKEETVFSMMDVYLENMAEEKLNKEIDKEKYAGINKYNHMGYKNVSGITVKEQADKEEMTFEEYKKIYGLPKDMPEDTYFDVAFNMMPIKVRLAIEEGETDFVTFKKNFNVPDYIEVKTKPSGFLDNFKACFGEKKSVTIEVTEDLPWGVVYDELTLDVVVGEEKFQQFKEEYNFGDDITLSTKYKEVRPIIEDEKIKNRDNVEESAEEVVEAPIEDVQPIPEEGADVEVPAYSSESGGITQ